MWGGLYTAVCTCAHRVHSAEQVFGDTDGETGLLSMWETRTPEGTGGPSKVFEDGKCVGSGGVCLKKTGNQRAM